MKGGVEVDIDARSQMRVFVEQLSKCVQGSVELYWVVGEQAEGEGKEIDKLRLWASYNVAFEEKIVAPIIDHLQRSQCGVLEVCHAVLKLMDFAARMYEVASKKDKEEDPIQKWFTSLQ